jgi:hypothetical protein
VEKKEILKKAIISFDNQKRRCENKDNKRYKGYGGKGIGVEYTRQEFIDWFMQNYPIVEAKWTIGRFDHNQSYKFGNIRFETYDENSLESANRHGGNISFSRRKTVYIFNSNFELIDEASGTREAAVKTELSQGEVATRCLHGNSLSARPPFCSYSKNKVNFRPKDCGIVVLDNTTKEPLMVFPTIAEAVEFTGVTKNTIKRRIKRMSNIPYIRKDCDYYDFRRVLSDIFRVETASLVDCR